MIESQFDNTAAPTSRKLELTPKESLRFWSKITILGPDDCWPWTSSKDALGYGRFTFRGETHKPYRMVVRIFQREYMEGECTLHSCDNPSCCNPAHLSPGTHLDNSRDKISKGRSFHIYGERHVKAKLTEADVREIRKVYNEGFRKPTAIALRYNVSRSTIKGIVSGANWKQLI